jgi:GNAT superfamily N-acetyltransferase
MEIKLVSYTSEYKKAFKELNEWWISKYFKMEAMDYHYLEHPEEKILHPGGYIVVALLNEKPVGVCALVKIKNGQFDYELAKMGVSPNAQGHGIGFLLGKAIIEKARQLGAKNIYLESNTILQPAINLYKKLGFTEISGIHTPYTRCNIQMELSL